MSFRIEEKLFIDKNYILDFKKLLNLKSSNKIYETRNIQSLYFENKNDDMYRDSIESITPRKKIRIRNYPNQSSKEFFLEKKISSVEGRFKKRTIINLDKFNEYKKIGIFDKNYGLCLPKILINYQREYFKIGDVRITIDENITYKPYSKESIKKDITSIIELKTSINKNFDDLIKEFPFHRKRFSKYCNAIDLLT